MMSPTIAAALLLSVPLVWQGDNAEQLLKDSIAALNKGELPEALELASKALKVAPTRADGYLLRGVIHEHLGNYAAAACDATRCLELDPKTAIAFNHRGSAYFKMGKIAASIEDFDTFLELRPAEAPGHWQRGISYYYAGRYDEGRKQFEGYEKVDTNDVENAVWHYLCVARKDGVAKARAGLLKIGKDSRVPMMEVYALFAGKVKPAEVLKAAETAKTPAEQLNRQRFYAHLYLGLYYEVEGDRKRALEHLEQAVQHPTAHYMWDVARVHRDLLKRK
jgi:lipoprotein NlpI